MFSRYKLQKIVTGTTAAASIFAVIVISSSAKSIGELFFDS